MAEEALKKGYKKEFLVKTGLCYETDDHQLRDRFWGRVIFPVHPYRVKWWLSAAVYLPVPQKESR